MDVIGKKIKEYREFIQLSIEEFSKECGIEEDRIKKLENGRLKAKLIDVAAISGTFNVSTDYLLGIDKSPHPIIHNEKEHAFWNKLESLSQEELTLLMDTLKDKE